MQASDFSKEMAANRKNWDARAGLHAKSEAYELQRYLDDPTAISSVVDWDRRLLGDVSGLDLLHLQCHIGTDTVSWARLGARVVGLDFSSAALEIARRFAADAGADVEFVQGNALDTDRVVRRTFDIVYASIGVLCWIPDVRAWAKAAAACVRPGGRLYLRDTHPLLATFDDRRTDGLMVCIDDYFRDGRAQREEHPYSYTGDEIPAPARENYQWNHGLGEVITAFAEQGLRVERVDEYAWLDWQAFPQMTPDEEGRWHFPPGSPRLPLDYSILARKVS